MPRSIQTSIRLKEEDLKRLEAEAERQCTTVVTVIRQAINKYFEEPAPSLCHFGLAGRPCFPPDRCRCLG